MNVDEKDRRPIQKWRTNARGSNDGIYLIWRISQHCA